MILPTQTFMSSSIILCAAVNGKTAALNSGSGSEGALKPSEQTFTWLKVLEKWGLQTADLTQTTERSQLNAANRTQSN